MPGSGPLHRTGSGSQATRPNPAGNAVVIRLSFARWRRHNPQGMKVRDRHTAARNPGDRLE